MERDLGCRVRLAPLHCPRGGASVLLTALLLTASRASVDLAATRWPEAKGVRALVEAYRTHSEAAHEWRTNLPTDHTGAEHTHPTVCVRSE